MAQSPSISFVIPARNESLIIGRCLEAINALSYDRALIEIIVIDDNSVDATALVARSIGARVIVPPHDTIAALRNLGAKEARGEMLAFIDADCVLAREWVVEALPHFEDCRVACVGSYPRVPEKASWVAKTWELHQRRYARVQEVEWLPSRTMLVKRWAFLEIRGFDESLVTCEDVDFCYRLRQRRYKIISDGNLRSMHFGEPSTVWEFFKKERWRGLSNFQGLLSHGLYRRELPSLMVPLYYSIALALLVLISGYSVFQKSYLPLWINVVFVLLPPLLLATRTAFDNRQIVGTPQLALLYFVYMLARTSAIFSGRKNDGRVPAHKTVDFTD